MQITLPNGPVQRLDGKWLAYSDGLPLMHPDFRNVVYPTKEAAEKALSKAA